MSAALLTCEDAIIRAAENGAGAGVGLRGGAFTAVAAQGGYRLLLQDLHWTEDLGVSGRIDWPGGHSRSHPNVTGRSRASARGTIGGRVVDADAPAP